MPSSLRLFVENDIMARRDINLRGRILASLPTKIRITLATTVLLSPPLAAWANNPLPSLHHNFQPVGNFNVPVHSTTPGSWTSHNYLQNSLPHLLAGPQTGGAGLLAGNQNYSLDLTSTVSNIILGTGALGGHPAVAVTLDGQKHSFAPGDKVTAAEFVAIEQMVTGGHQTLVMNGGGAAISGNFNLNNVASTHVAELVVPQGVSAIDNASRPVRLGGDLINYGTIYSVSTNPGTHTAVISGKDIVNEAGGLITTIAPASLVATVGGVLGHLNLTLNSVDSITNAGSINSTGDITFGLGSGYLTNTGTVTSSHGNINIYDLNSSNINILATSGTFSAKTGDINIRSAAYSGSADISINGGSYLSRNFNLYSGSGAIEGSFEDVSGIVNTSAAVDHISADTAVLTLGRNCVTGDPTYVNRGGDIRLVGAQSFGQDVAILASGNITAAQGASITASGHNVTLIAGVQIKTAGDGGNSPKVDGLGGGNQIFSASGATIDNTLSGNGGNIDLRGAGGGVLIDTSTTANSTNAGAVTLVASAKGTNGGQILLPTNSDIFTTASGAGSQGGNVTIIAGGTAGKGGVTIQTGSISTGNVGSTTGGSITIATAQPVTSDNKTMTFDSTGATVSGNTITSNTIVSVAQVNIGGDLISAARGGLIASATGSSTGGSGGAINIHAGDTVTTKNILAFGGGGQGGTDTSINGGDGGAGGGVSITSDNASVTINGQINTAGGGGGGGYSLGAGAGGAGGNAGQIALNAGTNVIANGPMYAIAGGAGGAGTNAPQIGGGGGGSFGGGGGGGGSGTVAGGNGGGGYGGGGGGGVLTKGVSGFVGGAGGGFTGGEGGSGGGGNGSNTISGVGAGGSFTGSTIGLGGIAANSKTAGNNGLDSNKNSGGNFIIVSATGTSSSQITNQLLADGIQIITRQAPFTLNTTMSTGTVIQLDALNISNGKGGFLDTTNLDIETGNAGPPGDAGSASAPLLTNAKVFVVTTNSFTSGNVFITSHFAGTGQLQAATAGNLQLTFDNPLSSLTITGKTAAGGNIKLGSVFLTVSQKLDFANNSTLTVGNKTQSGSLGLIAQNITWTNSATTPLSLSSSAQSFGLDGGQILVSAQATNSAPITIGTAAGQLMLAARGGLGGASNGNGGSINLSTGQLTIADANGIDVQTAGANGNGGSINLSVGSLAYAGHLNLSATGGGAGNVGIGSGGSITVSQSNSLANLSIGKGATDVSFDVSNGGQSSSPLTKGGSVDITTDGTMTVDTVGLRIASATTNLNGGAITLQAQSITNSKAGPLPLNADGMGTGDGGTIRLALTGPAAVTLGTKTADFGLSAQSGAAGGNGGRIAISSAGDLYFETNPSGIPLGVLIGPRGANGNGGGLTLTANSFNNGIFGGALSATALVFDASGVGTGVGGGIQLVSSTTATLNIGTATVTGPVNPGDVNISLVANNGLAGTNAGSVTAIAVTGTLHIDNIGALSILKDPGGKTAANINGGGITLAAGAITYTNSGAAPLIVNSSGLGTGNGGLSFVDVLGLGINKPTITAGKNAGQFELISNSGKTGGAGGHASLISGGSLIVNPSGFSVGPLGANGAGGNISLTANDSSAAGILQINGPLSVAGKGTGSGGSLNISSGAAVPFTIGVSASIKGAFNGMKGAPTMGGKTGGILAVSANGGSIITTVAISTPAQIILAALSDIQLQAKLGGTTTSNVNLNALGNIYGTSTATLAAKQVQLLAIGNIAGGSVSKGVFTPSVALPLPVNTAGLRLQSTAGAVNTKDSAATTVTVSDSFAGTDFKLTTAKGINIQSTTPGFSTGIEASTITLTSGTAGAINTLSGASLAAPTVTLTTGSAASVIAIQASDLSITATGLATVNSLISGSLVLEKASATKGLVLQTPGHIQVGKVSTTPVGSSTSIITISAADMSTNAPLIAKALSVVSADGSIGSGLAPFTVNTPTLTVTSNGAVVINDVSTKTTTLKTSSAGSLTLNTGAATTLNSISTTSGAINVTSNLPVVNGALVTAPAPTDKFAAGALQTVANAALSAPNGAIALQNSNIKAGSIIIAAGTTIMTGRPSGGGGNVYITIGAPPVTPVVGPAILNASITQIGSGQVFAGTNGIKASLSKGIGNALIADMANIIFSTGSLKATAISLGGNTTIIADPPLSAGMANTFEPTINPGTLPVAPGAVQSTAESALHPVLPQTIQTTHSPLAINLIPQALTPSNNFAASNLFAGQYTKWATETELLNGSIPANWLSDLDLNFGDEERGSFDISENHLSRGTAIVAPRQDRELITPLGKVSIKANSIVLVIASADRLSIYDLHDSCSDAVRINSSGSTITLRPGQHTTICKDLTNDFSEINPAQLFGYRRMNHVTLADNLRAFSSEFSLPQAIAVVPTLRKLVISNKAEHRKLAQPLLKTMSILMQLDGATSCRFKQYRLPPRNTLVAMTD